MDPGWDAAAGKGQNSRFRMGVCEEAGEGNERIGGPEQVLPLRNPQTRSHRRLLGKGTLPKRHSDRVYQKDPFFLFLV